MRISVGIAELALHGDDRSLAAVAEGLFGVFDGVGGVPGSAQAAAFAADEIPRRCRAAGKPSVEALAAACEAADLGIRRRGLGCSTATVVWLGGASAHWVSIGDSRLYLLREEELRQVSRDQGEGNIVDNVLGMPWSRAALTAQRGTVELRPGDRLALVSDGVTGDYPPDILSAGELRTAMGAPAPQAAADALLRVARKHDDRTAVVLDVG